MDTYDLLKEDLVQMAIRYYTRAEAEVLASCIIDLIAEIAEDTATNVLQEHCSTFDHDFKEEY